MAHYAQIENNKVVQVLTTIDDDAMAQKWLFETFGGTWIKASYNTRGGIHYGPDNKPDGKTQIRYNFPGIDYIYNLDADAFYAPFGPFPSWVLNKNTYAWEPPTPRPENVVSQWNEETVSWDLVPSPYPSWVCINNGWFPPIPFPGVGWSWDEESVSWIPDNPIVRAQNG